MAAKFLCFALALSGSAAAAQDIDPAALSDADLAALRAEVARQLDRAAPVTITGIRSGYGLSYGDLSIGAAATDRRERRFDDDFDASLALAFGLGNADTAIGATVGVDITSVSPFHFAESGIVGVTLHRRFEVPGDWQGSLAVGAENLVTWGDSETLSREYSVAASFFRPGSADGPPLLASFGYGTGILEGTDDDGALFGGLGVGLTPQTAASLAWTGDEVIAGWSLWSDNLDGAVITFGVGDLTNEIDGRRGIIALSWTGSFGP